jgi:hypothetical protein
MTTHLLSIDIESTGDRFNNSVIAIGLVFGAADGSWPRERLIKFRGNLKPLPGDVDDPLRMSEFWAKFPGVYREIIASAEDAAVVMRKFLHFCQELVATYEDDPVTSGKIKIVTDCPDLYAVSESFVLKLLVTSVASITWVKWPPRRGPRLSAISASPMLAMARSTPASVSTLSVSTASAKSGSRETCLESCTTTARRMTPSTRTTRWSTSIARGKDL